MDNTRKGFKLTPTHKDKQIEKLEKENAELTDRLDQLQEQNSEMFNTIVLQEQQIEKMKCCENCAENDKYDFYDDTWHDDVCGDCENQCNWKLKE